MNDVTMRPATPDDAGALSAFARRVFDEVFGPDNNSDDMAAYMDEAFTPDVQRREIEAVGSIILLAEQGGAIAGYLHIDPSPTPTCVTGRDAIELKRLYVDPRLHSRGTGKRLLDEGVSRARAAGAATLWLGVWEHNVKAQRFYQREGFQRVGEHAFVLGRDVQTDWIMQRPIA